MPPVPPPSGNLSEYSPVRLYYLVASAEQTGLLSFQLADRLIDVRFRKGNPEHVSSSHLQDSLAEYLRVHHLLNEAQLEHAQRSLGDFGNDLVSALFGLGLLTPATAFSNLAEHALYVLLKAIVAEQGTFTYQDSLLSPVKVMPLGNRWAVLTALLRRIPIAEVKLRLANDADRPLTKVDGRLALKELPLTPQETRALNYLNGNDSLNELASKFPADSENLHRLALLLRDVDLMSLSTAPSTPAVLVGSRTPAPTSQAPPPAQGRREMSSRPAAPGPPVLTPSRGVPTLTPSKGGAPAPPRLTPSKGVAPSVPPVASRQLTPSKGVGAAAASANASPQLTPSRGMAPAANPANVSARLTPSKGVSPQVTPSKGLAPSAPVADPEVERLREIAIRVKDEDYFQVLGVGRKADASGVKSAYIKLAKLYHPDSTPSTASPDISKLKEEIFTVIGQAYRVLSDDRSRANYSEILDGEESDLEMLPLSQVLLAEEKFERGRNLIRAKRFAEAVPILDEAISGSQEVAEFWAWRGYAKFFALEDKKKAQAEATRDLQTALQKSSHCASAHYFLGHIAKLSGDSKTALAQFKKAVELKPDHIDAKREIRLLTKK